MDKKNIDTLFFPTKENYSKLFNCFDITKNEKFTIKEDADFVRILINNTKIDKSKILNNLKEILDKMINVEKITLFSSDNDLLSEVINNVVFKYPKIKFIDIHAFGKGSKLKLLYIPDNVVQLKLPSANLSEETIEAIVTNTAIRILDISDTKLNSHIIEKMFLNKRLMRLVMDAPLRNNADWGKYITSLELVSGRFELPNNTSPMPNLQFLDMTCSVKSFPFFGKIMLSPKLKTVVLLLLNENKVAKETLELISTSKTLKDISLTSVRKIKFLQDYLPEKTERLVLKNFYVSKIFWKSLQELQLFNCKKESGKLLSKDDIDEMKNSKLMKLSTIIVSNEKHKEIMYNSDILRIY